MLPGIWWIRLHWMHRPVQVVLFLKTGQSQLGAEGFIMGALYTTVGLCLALLTHGAPYIPHKQAQMGVSFMILLVTVLCYLNIKSTYQWKTGEHVLCTGLHLSVEAMSSCISSLPLATTSYVCRSFTAMVHLRWRIL